MILTPVKFVFDENVILGIDNYMKIMNVISDTGTDVSSDTDFQNTYIEYYFPEHVKPDFQKKYFQLMQESRYTCPSFKETMDSIYQFSEEVHYNFASKLLHTINNESPLLDQHIMRLLGYKLMKRKQLLRKDPEYDNKKAENAKERIEYYSNVYSTVTEEFEVYKTNPVIQNAINTFDSTFPAYKELSFAKKIDLLLSRLKDERGASILEYIILTK